MSRYKPRYKTTRRRLNVKLIVALIALVGGVSAIGLGVMNISKSKSLAQANEKIETIKTETTNIEKQIPELESTIKALNEEISSLQNIIWRHEPVVIPDSMK